MNHLKSKGMLFILAIIAIYAVAHSSLMRSNGVDLKLSVFLRRRSLVAHLHVFRHTDFSSAQSC